MPSDIRSFFGGSASQPLRPKGPQTTPKKDPPEKKGRGRPKRKVVSDSDDDDVEAAPKRGSTPKKVQVKKTKKQDSPVGEVTTTSDYFASSGKSKPTRSTPTRSRAQKKTEDSEPAATRSTPKKKDVLNAEPSTSGRASSRKKVKPNYAEEDSDDYGESAFKTVGDDEESGQDVFEDDFKNGRRGGKDEYESDDDEEVLVRAKPKSAQKSKTTRSRQQPEIDDDDDVMVVERPLKDIPQYKSPTSKKESHETNVAKSRKRRSVELEDEEAIQEEEKPSKKSKSTTKSPAKKATPKKQGTAAADPPARTEVDDIFDSIPMVKPPTPPPRDPNKKFDFRAAGHRAEAPTTGGSTEMPTGAENCLAGLSFVFTGVLATLQREAGQALVKQYGGKVTIAPSKKTSFVVLGSDAGPKKLETIQQYGLKTIDEGGLFELIKKLPAHGGDGKAAEESAAKAKKEEDRVAKEAAAMEEQEQAALQQQKARDQARAASKPSLQSSSAPGNKIAASDGKDTRLWTVKYAPTAINMICGNKGQVEKLQGWLRAWPQNVKRKFKMGGKDGYGAFRAMCLHGPPGIGKTTAAHLAARLEGYDVVESNASDARSKKLVETGLKGVLDTTSLLGYFAGDGQKVESSKKKLVLIMDEVDGMSAGDRGGVGAMAAICRKTTIPIILICNDRRLPKMRPFDSVSFDLPFRRPTIDQIRSRILTICYREGLKISPNVINALIEGSRADIRQVINMLSTAKLDFDQEGMDFEKGKKMSQSWEKNIILKPWDIVGKILGGGMFASSSTSGLNEKIELYFNDHEFSSLMLQENYLGTSPIIANAYSGKERDLKRLELTDKAAESISDGDLVDRMIHGSQQQWSLMPTHAVFSFVRPASFVSGSLAGNQTRFTSWLGNNSKLGKLSRFVKEIQGHMRLHSSGDRHEVRQQYYPLLWYKLVKKLQEEGKEAVSDIIDLMDSYYLTKDDWEAILELGVGDMDMENIKIDGTLKGAFTRAYNAVPHPLPFMKASQVIAPKKKTKERPDLEEALDESDSGADTGDEQPVLEDEEPLDLKKDKYVKAPKKTAASKAAKGGKAGKGKQGGKGKGQATAVEEDEDEDSEDAKPSKGKAKGKAGGAGRGRPKK